MVATEDVRLADAGPLQVGAAEGDRSPLRLVIHWDAWTRRRQARSRWLHKRARPARHAEIALVS